MAVESFFCNCGAAYKTETGLTKHITICPYANIDFNKIYQLAYIISDANKMLFFIGASKVRALARKMNIGELEAKDFLFKELAYKYRKSLWDIYLVWTENLLKSEFRTFAKWVFKTYKDISLTTMKSVLTNPKILYRFDITNSYNAISSRISESIDFIEEYNSEFSNDYEFVDYLLNGKITMFYVLFNDYLAEKWYGQLDKQLQKDLEKSIEYLSKIVNERLKPDEFDKLQKQANTITPKILAI